jgi:hypothetical protein
MDRPVNGVGRFMLQDCLILMWEGAHIKIVPEGALPTWVEVTECDAESRYVTYRVLTNDEFIALDLNPVPR